VYAPDDRGQDHCRDKDIPFFKGDSAKSMTGKHMGMSRTVSGRGGRDGIDAFGSLGDQDDDIDVFVEVVPTPAEVMIPRVSLPHATNLFFYQIYSPSRIISNWLFQQVGVHRIYMP
jgi:hypothetical protein